MLVPHHVGSYETIGASATVESHVSCDDATMIEALKCHGPLLSVRTSSSRRVTFVITCIGNLLDSDAQTSLVPSSVELWGRHSARVQKRFPAIPDTRSAGAVKVYAQASVPYKPYSSICSELPTKGTGSPSRLDIEAGLDWLTRHYESGHHIAGQIPCLGCATAALSGPQWNRSYRCLNRLTIPVELCRLKTKPAQSRQGGLDLTSRRLLAYAIMNNHCLRRPVA